MGSTVVHNTEHLSWKEFIYQEFTEDNYKILHYSKVGSIVYLAVKRDERVFAVVVKCFLDYGNKGYKEMSESMGPLYYDAPKVLLDKLTPTESEYAIEWRQACRDKAAARKVKVGDKVRFTDPVCWQGKQETEFEVVRFPSVRGFVCKSLKTGDLVRVSKIDDREKVWI